MPDAFEFPRMLCAIVPLMGAWHAVVNEIVAFAFRHSLRSSSVRPTPRRVPSFAAVVGSLNDLSKPTARLRRINPVRITGDPFR